PRKSRGSRRTDAASVNCFDTRPESPESLRPFGVADGGVEYPWYRHSSTPAYNPRRQSVRWRYPDGYEGPALEDRGREGGGRRHDQPRSGRYHLAAGADHRAGDRPSGGG